MMAKTTSSKNKLRGSTTNEKDTKTTNQQNEQGDGQIPDLCGCSFSGLCSGHEVRSMLEEDKDEQIIEAETLEEVEDLLPEIFKPQAE